MESEELDALFDHILEEINDPECPPVSDPFGGTVKIDMSRLIRFHYVVPPRVTVADDGMSASIFISSNRDDDFTLEELRKAVSEKGVTAGIDEELLERIAAEQLCDEEIVFARGEPAVNGADGSFEILAQADTDVKQGDEICRLIAGEEGADGFDVFGNVLHGENGHAPGVPQGKNTCLNSSHTALIAAADGRLTYEDGFFSVRNEYIVQGDLKRPDDRIDFGGDVMIYGNVSEGAFINAGGNVYIRGSVTGATVVAKSITADFTVRTSSLTANSGNIRILNCENTEIKCDGNIHASSLIECNVFCSGEISCLSGQGVICGGIIFCIGKIICQTVGSQMHEPTRLILGNSADFMNEKRELEEKIAVIDLDIRKLDVHAGILRRQKAVGEISQEDEDFLHAATRIKLQKTLKKEPLENRLKYVDHIIESSDESSLKVTNTLHQNATITIRARTATTDIRHNKVTVVESDTGLIYM